MQSDSIMNKSQSQSQSKDNFSNLNPSMKDFYSTSLLKYNTLSELCNEISNTESLDINVEKFLSEIADNYVESVLDTACQIAKHKKSDYLTASDLSIAMGKQ
jgi:transcription initiation factor TFIID subunit TAF12